MTTLRTVPFNLSDDVREQTIGNLQSWLPSLIGLTLRLKQAHWNLRGVRFKSVHEQLDEILADARDAVDDVAERIVTLGGAADGVPSTVSSYAGFGPFPAGLLSVETAIDTICSDLAAVVRDGRRHIGSIGEVDPVSEDLAIGIVGAVEKHHWMLHSQREAD
ncbi:MAG: DNA starvation/stationary phase protection protein [Planctomycetes bacterium]|nr:DNA starvation/stationary phase protection protein [Planctomycetota bacterium]